ncbi:MAG: SdpI family protein [Mycobacteriaceae bacterium]
MTLLAVVLIVAAVVLAGVAIAGLTENLPRNRWAGIRTNETLQDEQTFKIANKIAAPGTLTASVVLGIGVGGALLLPTKLALCIVITCIIGATIITTLVGRTAVQAAQKLSIKADKDSCSGSCGTCALKGDCTPH